MSSPSDELPEVLRAFLDPSRERFLEWLAVSAASDRWTMVERFTRKSHSQGQQVSVMAVGCEGRR